MNLEGKILGNRYEIIEKIGNGGMATVYKAKCLVLNRYVAVKILRDEFTTDEEFIRRFNIEAQAAASITHPNIVSVYDVGNDDNLYYIVMELVKGKTLKEIITEDGKLSWKWSVKVARQIASALEIAHKSNIVHRDIKPHNIIITEDGIAKVTDFGIAKAVSNSTITAFGTTLGSVHYFSPEHARGGFTDAKSDLYSLGVVMYEMVTGRVPFDADTPVSVALKHMQEEPIEPIVLNPDIPVSVNKIIMKAMQKDVNFRYQNATEMIMDLDMAIKTPDRDFVTIPFGANNEKTRVISTEEIEEEEKRVNNKRADGKVKKITKMKEYFEKHKGMKILALCLLAILVVCVAFGGAFFIFSLGKAKEVQIPNLVGLTMEEAEAKVKELNLKIQMSEEKNDPEIEAGKILEQDPVYQDNFKIKEGITIKVAVSKGQEIVKMTKVIGKTKDEATKELKKLNLNVIVEEENSDEVESGYVIKQSVEENQDIPAGSDITIYVSAGIEQVEVPNLAGKTESDAKTAITNAKLKWKSTTKISDSNKPNGLVSDQSISAGSYVDKETEITITVNEFDEIKTGTITVNVKSLRNYSTNYKKQSDGTEVELDPEKVQLRVMAGDDKIYDSQVSEASTAVNANVSGTGTVVIKVYINDVLKKTQSLNLSTTASLTID